MIVPDLCQPQRQIVFLQIISREIEANCEIVSALGLSIYIIQYTYVVQFTVL